MTYLSIYALLFSLLAFADARLDCDCSPNLSNRIVNGEKASNHEFPWQLSLGLQTQKGKSSHICGASLLNSEWAVTASHCVVDHQNEPSLFRIGYGSNNLDDMTDDKRISAKRIIVHPEYQPKVASSKGDIALIQLSKPIDLTSHVRPACLMKSSDELNDILENASDTVFTASGWGSVDRTYKWIFGPMRGGRISNDLKKGNFYAYKLNDARSDCRRRPDLICITPETRGDSVCNGDSGGPLQFALEQVGTSNNTDVDFNTVVVGVTSFGSGDLSILGYLTYCNGKGAYTKIPYFNNFVTSYISEDNLCMV